MSPISYARLHYPPSIVQHAVWLYLRISLSLRDVEDLLAERGLDLSYETVRRWVTRFGSAYARRLRAMRRQACDTRHRVRDNVSVCIHCGMSPSEALEQSRFALSATLGAQDRN